jgi:ATP-binding cassette, subfamily C, type I secretion system permease/ATPase
MNVGSAGQQQPAGKPGKAGASGLEAAARTYASCRRTLWAVGLFSLAISVLLLTTPLFMLQVYDRVLGSGSVHTLMMLTLLAAGALALLAFLDGLRQNILSRIGLRLETGLGGPLLAASIEATARGKNPDAQALRDLAQIRAFITSPAVATLFELPMVPLFVILMFMVHPLLGSVTGIGAGTLLLLAWLNQRAAKNALAETSKHSLAAMGSAQAYVRNAELVHAMGLYPEAVANWGKHNAKALEAQGRASAAGSGLAATSRFIRLLLQIGLLGFGALLVLDQKMTGGMIIAGSIIGGRALAPVEGIISSWRNLVQAREADSRIKDLLARTGEIVDRVKLPRPKGQLSFEGVSYAPRPGMPPILRGLTFQIMPGESIGIVGPPGAGKSTLARLAIGAIAPSSGTVRLDGADVNQWTRDEFGEHVGYLQQHPEFFPGTVAQNIARMRADASAEAIVAAGQLSGAHDLIVRLPNGYETMLGPGGVDLSGGQRQRVGLARAFFGSPRLIILDEPNANLDSTGDNALALAIRRARDQHATIIVIAQRPRAVQSVDRIMVLQNGAIATFGPRREVLPKILSPTSAKPQPGRPAAPARGHPMMSVVPGGKPSA